MDFLLQSIEFQPKELSFKRLENKLSHTLSKVQKQRFREVQSLLAEHKVYQAYACLKAHLSRQRKDSFAQYLAGRIALVCGDFQLSQSHLSQAYFHATKDSELSKHCFISLAKTFINSRQLDRCQSLLLEQERHNPCFELYAISGFYHQKVKQFTRSVVAYETALKLNPNAYLVRLSLIKLMIHQDQIDKAQHEISKLKQARVKHPDFYAVNAIISHKPQRDQLAFIKKALKLERKHGLSLLLLGDYYLNHKPKLAIKYYSMALEDHKSFFIIYKKLAEALALEHRYEEAIAQLLMYRCFVSESKHVKVQHDIALLHEKQKKHEKKLLQYSKKSWWKVF